MTALRAPDISATFEPHCGFLTDLTITDVGRIIAPLHRAPWIGEAMPAGKPPHHARLQGDFFCAPFTDGGTGSAPLHGWPANGDWTVTVDTGHSLTAVLAQQVQGASVTKTLTLAHPFVYQRHTFTGGTGTLSAANHAMVSLPYGGLLAFSQKQSFRTGPTAPEPDPARGRSSLTYPHRSTDPRNFAGTDLTTYPWGPAHEDFVVATEAPDTPLGWTAVVRPHEGDVFLSLRNPAQLPHTMLWHSNGGRDYAPWSGRHRACLGIEEGIAGHTIGTPDALTLGGTVVVNHVMGALAWPSGQRIATVTQTADTLTLTGTEGATRTVPFHAAHLTGA